MKNQWEEVSAVLTDSVSYGVADEFSDLDLLIISQEDAIKNFYPLLSQLLSLAFFQNRQ